MYNKNFSYSDALWFGWDVMKQNFWFFAGVCIITFLLSLTGQILQNVMANFPDAIPAFLIIPLIVVGLIVEVIVAIGLIKIALGFCDNQKPSLSTLFDARGCFFNYLGTAIVFGLVVASPILLTVLLIVLMSRTAVLPCLAIPVFFAAGIVAVFLSIKYSLCFYFVVDKGLGPIKALKASGRTTMGARWQLLLFGGLCGLVNLLGFICLGLGLLATVPTVLVALALVYRQLSQQTPGLAGLGINSPAVQPAGHIAEGLPTGPPSAVGSGELLGLGVRLALGTPVAPPQSVPDVAPNNTPGRRDLFFFLAITAGVLILIAVLIYSFLPGLRQAVVQPSHMQVTAILYSDSPSCIIDGEIVKEGQTVKGATVVKIHRDKIEFEKDERRWTQSPSPP